MPRVRRAIEAVISKAKASDFRKSVTAADGAEAYIYSSGCGKGCRGWRGFRITIFDNRTRGDNAKPRLERVVVAGE